MDSYTRSVVNLMVLAKLRDHERLTVTGGIFSIESVSTSRARWVWSIITRSLSNQSRETTIRHLTFLVTDCERFCDDDSYRQLIAESIKRGGGHAVSLRF